MIYEKEGHSYSLSQIKYLIALELKKVVTNYIWTSNKHTSEWSLGTSRLMEGKVTQLDGEIAIENDTVSFGFLESTTFSN